MISKPKPMIILTNAGCGGVDRVRLNVEDGKSYEIANDARTVADKIREINENQ